MSEHLSCPYAEFDRSEWKSWGLVTRVKIVVASRSKVPTHSGVPKAEHNKDRRRLFRHEYCCVGCTQICHIVLWQGSTVSAGYWVYMVC